MSWGNNTTEGCIVSPLKRDLSHSKLEFLENEIKNNKKVYNWMKTYYYNIFGVGDVIINEWLDNTINNIKSHEITKYPYLIDDMYYYYRLRLNSIYT